MLPVVPVYPTLGALMVPAGIAEDRLEIDMIDPRHLVPPPGRDIETRGWFAGFRIKKRGLQCLGGHVACRFMTLFS
jgi:hypothetical protein